MSETGQKNEEKIKRIKEESEKIMEEIKKMYKVLEEVAMWNREINDKFNELIQKWYCVFDIALGYYRHDCRFYTYPTSDRVVVTTDTPSPMRIEVMDKDDLSISKVKEIIREELVSKFHYQIMGTTERLINILEIVRDTVNKNLFNKYKELAEKVDRLYEKINNLQNEITELEEGVELIEEIERLREEKADLAMEVENLKNLRDDLRDEIKLLQQQLQQQQLQQ